MQNAREYIINNVMLLDSSCLELILALNLMSTLYNCHHVIMHFVPFVH